MPDSPTLAVDIGNTNVRLGLFTSRSLDARWSLKTDTSNDRDDYGVALTVLFQRRGLRPEDVGHAVIGSVVPPLTSVFEAVIREYCGVKALVVRAGTRTGVKLTYDPLFELGADRIAHAVAADHLYGTPAIVVDFGTATTFDAIGENGAYMGGAIAPGLAIAAEALWQRTAQLQRVDLKLPDHSIGRNTADAVQSGLVLGHIGLTREMIRRIAAEMGGSPRIIATGGHAGLIAPEVPEIEMVDADLALHGLYFIHELNVATGKRQESMK